MFDFSIEVNNIQLKPSRQGDEWLMVKFWEFGFDTEDLLILYRVRIHQPVMFLSDVMDTGGRRLDKKYLKKRSQGENWLTLRFPVERPPSAHFKKWKEVLLAIAAGIEVRVKDFTLAGHKTWDWRLDEDDRNTARTRLLHIKCEVMDVCTKSQLDQFVNRHNRWTRMSLNVPAEVVGYICSVKKSEPPPTPTPPDTFFEVLNEWGCEWMWGSLRLQGDEGWLTESIAGGD